MTIALPFPSIIRPRRQRLVIPCARCKRRADALRDLVSRFAPFTLFPPSGAGCACTPAYDSGDRRASITVTTNLTTGNGTLNLILDGNVAPDATTAWGPNSQTVDNTKFLRFQWNSQRKITEITFSGDASSHGVWRWQGSNDGTSWTNIGSTFTLTINTPLTAMSAATDGYIYHQFAGVSGSTVFAWWSEINFKICTC